jgi:hypothetical protein
MIAISLNEKGKKDIVHMANKTRASSDDQIQYV